MLEQASLAANSNVRSQWLSLAGEGKPCICWQLSDFCCYWNSKDNIISAVTKRCEEFFRIRVSTDLKIWHATRSNDKKALVLFSISAQSWILYFTTASAIPGNQRVNLYRRRMSMWHTAVVMVPMQFLRSWKVLEFNSWSSRPGKVLEFHYWVWKKFKISSEILRFKLTGITLSRATDA